MIIKSYTKGAMVVIWCNFTYKQYWFFNYKEAVATFKKELYKCVSDNIFQLSTETSLDSSFHITGK
jgi:hypothetical protein